MKRERQAYARTACPRPSAQRPRSRVPGPTSRFLAGILLLVPVLVLPTSLAAQPTDFAALRDETARVLAEYLRLDTSNPPGNELVAARWLQAFLAREGIEAQILDAAELGAGRANLYARLRATAAPPGARGRRAVALVHHMDVVPADAREWSVPPFAGELRDGFVYGRGALDMKGHGIIQLMTLVALKRSGAPLPRDLVLIANADEEVDGRGASVFVERHPDLLADVAFVLTEDGGTRVEQGRVRWFGIGVGEKRAYWLRLVARGTAGHASVPLADNPVPRVARAVARAAAWETPLRLTPAVDRFLRAIARHETGDAARWLGDAAAALREPAGRAFLLADPARAALLRNTISPTVLTGSGKTNSIPSVASAELDVRLLPDEDTAAFRAELARVIDDPGITIELVAPVLPRFDAPLDTEMFAAIERAAARLLPGVPVASVVDVGTSDRPTYMAAGAVPYGVTPGLAEWEDERRGVHGIDERVSLASIEFGLRLYAEILRELR